MKTTIRKNVFETNSSSIHTLSVVRKPKTIKYPKEIVFGSDEFGWENETYTDTNSKAAYIWELIRYYSDNFDIIQNIIKSITDILKKHGITAKFVYGNIDKVHTAHEYNGNTYEHNYLEFKDEDGVEDDGYIDHGNEGKEFINALLNNEELLLSFLFCEDSYLITGNDNEDDDEYPTPPTKTYNGIDERYEYEKVN